MYRNVIDIGPASPQVGLRAWKSPGWRGFANAFPPSMGGLLLLVGFLVAGNPRDAETAPIFFAIAILLFLTAIPLRILGKTEYRLGFDWKKNALWVFRGNKGITGVEYDASKIIGFSFSEKASFTINGTWYVNPSMPFLWHKREWILTVGRVGSQFQFGVAGSGLASKNEALQVVLKANTLLRSGRA